MGMLVLSGRWTRDSVQFDSGVWIYYSLDAVMIAITQLLTSLTCDANGLELFRRLKSLTMN
jgi:hypothetical protein